MSYLRTLSSAHMFHAANKCGWDDEQKMTVYCSHIATIIPAGDFDKLFETTKNWSLDSGLATELVLHALAHIIDEIEAAPDYKGDRFEEYIKSLMEASGAKTNTDEKKEPEKPKTGKGRGRPRKTAEAPAETTKASPKGALAPAPARSPTKEKSEPKFPAGTVTTPAPTPFAAAPVPVASTEPPKVMLCGYLEQPFCNITKELLALEAPLKDQRLGTLMAKQVIQLPGGLELNLDLVNSRPKPGVDVYIRNVATGTSVAQLQLPVREYTERYEITYQGTTYKVLPPGG